MSSLDSSTVSSSSGAGTTTCHALPCNIDYTGRAPVDAYFRPAPITLPLKGGDHDDDASSTRPQYQAATFRGRGLLARCPDTEGDKSKKFQGLVLSNHNNDGGQQQLQTVQTFDSLIEWHHEHFTSAVDQKPSRLQTAVDWLETASALHAPIPVPKKNSAS